MIQIYLIFLVIAPQLWWLPILDWRTDFLIFPAWILVAIAKRNTGYTIGQAEKVVLLAALWFILSALANGLSHYSLEELKLYGPRILVYFLTVMTLRNFRETKRVIHFFVLLSVLLAVEGIQHKFSVSGIGWAGQERGWIDPSVLAAGGTGRTRWVGVFDGPGVFSVVYIIALPFLLFRIIGPFKKPTRIMNFGLFLLMLFAIYVNGSRGGLLATMAILGIGLVYRIKISMKMVILFGAASLVLFALAPSHLTTVKDSQNSSAHRIDMWVEGFEMVAQNPLFGIGIGEFGHYTRNLIAHNSHMQLMGETGLPGYFLWLTISYLALRTMFRLVHDPNIAPEQKAFAWALGAAIIGYHVASFFVTLEYVTFYLLLAFASHHNFYPNQKEAPLTKLDYRIILGTGSAILASFWLMIKLYQL